MRTDIYCVNCKEDDAIRSTIEKKMASIVRRFAKEKKELHLIARVNVPVFYSNGLPKQFVVELLFAHPLWDWIVVKKKNGKLMTALNEALHSLKTVIQKKTEKFESGRKTLGHNRKKVRELKRRGFVEATDESSL